MEFNERNTQPELTRNFLQQQVEEQAEFCDITVKMGHWERKYHRCVLSASPFFECIFRFDFLEKISGVINMSIGTPATVDMALMYLYGKRPQLNDTNIEVMFELAEFYLMPSLKADCVTWLRNQPSSDDNCLTHLQLSSKYGFDQPECTKYLEGHLDVILAQQSSTSLSYEFIYHIFTNIRLCYFQMEDRLRFLIRWYKALPEMRIELVEKLIKTIDFDDVPISSIKEIKKDLDNETFLDFIHEGSDDTGCMQTDVLISKTYGGFLCYDLVRDIWYNFKLTNIDQNTLPRYISDINTVSAEALFTKSCSHDHKVTSLNLVTNELKTYEVVINTNEAVKKSEVFHYANNVGVLCQCKTMHTRSNDSNSSVGEFYQRNKNRRFSPYYQSEIRTISTVLLGSIKDGKIQAVPSFSVVDFEIKSVSVNTNSVIALISLPNTCVFIYDIVNCTMDKIETQTDFKDKIVPAKNGFVIHNNKRYKTIIRMSGPALSVRYAVKEFKFSDKHYSSVQYYYCNSSWFRYFCGPYNLIGHFQCVDRRELEDALSPADIKWKELSLPKGAFAFTSSTLGETMHVVRLPRRLLRCHVECPHCVAEKRNCSVVRTTQYNDDGSDKYDSSDSNDDNLIFYGGSDSSEYYYNSSD